MPNRVLSARFYQRDVVQVARELIGQILVSTQEGARTWGRIVETEAYLSAGDPACHGARGQTRSNASMFGPGGRAYVYPIHSRHCFNVVTQATGEPSAVLIRAVQPLGGLRTMQRRRGRPNPHDWTRGPGRLCEALAIDRRLDGVSLISRRKLWIEASDLPPPAEHQIRVTPRIGVTSAEDLELRFALSGNPFVSGPRSLR